MTAEQAAGLNDLITRNLSAGLDVSDNAGDVTTYLDALQTLFVADHLASIVWTGGAPATLSISAGTLVSDAGALGTIGDGYTINLTSGSVTADEAVALGAGANVASHVSGGLPVHDSGTNVTNDLNSLETMNSDIGSISVQGVPTITVTAGTLAADASVLAKIGGSWNLAVSSGSLTAAQVTTIVDDGLITHLDGTVAVTDKAAHLIGSLDQLQSLAAGSNLGTVTMTSRTT